MTENKSARGFMSQAAEKGWSVGPGRVVKAAKASRNIPLTRPLEPLGRVHVPRPRNPVDAEIRAFGQIPFFVALFTAIFIIAMFEVREWKPLDKEESLLAIGEVFYAIFGLMYAIIVGLLIVEANKRWRELSSTVQSEINAIGVIHDCLRYFDDSPANTKAKTEINNIFIEYVKYLGRDLRRLDSSRTDARRLERFSGRGVTALIHNVKMLESDHAVESHARGKIIDAIGDVTVLRSNRLELSEHGLPKAFFLLVGFMSFAIVIGVLFFDIENPWLHGGMVFTITTVLVTLFLMLWDMDRPFTGFWKIDEDSMDDIKSKLDPGQSDAATASAAHHALSDARESEYSPFGDIEEGPPHGNNAT